MIYGSYSVIKEKKDLAYILILFVLSVNMIVFFLQGNPRFIMPILPVYFMLSFYGLYTLLKKFNFKYL